MKIGNFDLKKKTLIIAEIGNNHEGNLNNAKKMISLASKAGANAVKFQTFKTENFINKKSLKRFKQLKKFELSQDQFKILKRFAHRKKVLFISTPYDMDSLKFLSKNSDAIKISSGDNNFFFLIKEALKSKKPLIISTGMLGKKEVDRLMSYINVFLSRNKINKRIALLHCVTSYPVEDKYANLNSIKYLLKNYKITIGYSDHTIGYEACLSAVSLGAKILEKHFTINKNFSSFRDHALSSDFKELKCIVKGVRKIESQLGSFGKKVQLPEKKYLRNIRRAVYAAETMEKDKKINIKNIKFLRPYTAGTTLNVKKIIGKKIKRKIIKNNKVSINNLF